MRVIFLLHRNDRMQEIQTKAKPNEIWILSTLCNNAWMNSKDQKTIRSFGWSTYSNRIRTIDKAYGTRKRVSVLHVISNIIIEMCLKIEKQIHEVLQFHSVCIIYCKALVRNSELKTLAEVSQRQEVQCTRERYLF